MNTNALSATLIYLDKELHNHMKSSKEYKTITKQKEEIVQLIIDITKRKMQLKEAYQ